MNQKSKYRTAKLYEIIFFATNNTATNIYNFMMGYISYYTVGVAGLAVVLVSTLLTAMRIFDGVVDPLIGYVIDKTDGRFGKFRPFIWLGNGVMIAMTLILFNTTHLVPDNFRLIYFLIVYGIYIIGYSFQTTVTKAGQNVITNDPKQRPLFSLFDGIFTTAFYTFAGIYVSGYLSGKYNGEFGLPFFTEFTNTAMIFSLILTVMATIGIWKKDQTKYFGLGFENQSEKITFRDYWQILKANRPLQMLTLAASTDKLGSKIRSNSITGVIFFGIMIGNYSLMGSISAIALLPGIIFNIVGAMLARKIGQKKTYVMAQFLALVFSVLNIVLFLVGNPQTISLSTWNFMTIGFVALVILGNVQAVGDAMQISMISDVTDYETARSGNYVPGLIGTIFSFVDNFFSSFSNSIVGAVVAVVGYRTTLPQVGDPLTAQLFTVGIALYLGAPAISWLVSLSAMHFYSLDAKKMEEVQLVIQERKERGLIATPASEQVSDSELKNIEIKSAI